MQDAEDTLVTMLSSSARTYWTVSSFVTFRSTVVSASIKAAPFCKQSNGHGDDNDRPGLTR